MRGVAMVLAAAATVAYAQDQDVRRALVRLRVHDQALDEALELKRRKAPREALQKLKIHQPYTLVLSGMVISKQGEILTTALHPRARLRVQVTFFDGSRHAATVVGSDPRSNLALVRVPAQTPYFVNLDAQEVTERQDIRIVGHVKDKPLEVEGIVAQRRVPVALRDLYRVNEGRTLKLGAVFMVATPAGGANPGSACLDSAGRVAGIVIGGMPPRMLKSDATNPPLPVYQLTFAVPAQRVVYIVGRLRKHGSVIRSFFGVELLPVEPALRAQFRLPASACAITRVHRGRPAARAGLKKDDVVLSVDGQSYANYIELAEAMGYKTPGSEVKLAILRRGKRLELRTVPVER